MTEQEMVQAALAALPRPAPPPRLRHAVMAQVRREADAPQVRTWSRTEANGWTAERWEGAGLPADTVPAPTPTRIAYTHWRQDDANGTMIYQFAQTD